MRRASSVEHKAIEVSLVPPRRDFTEPGGGVLALPSVPVAEEHFPDLRICAKGHEPVIIPRNEQTAETDPAISRMRLKESIGLERARPAEADLETPAPDTELDVSHAGDGTGPTAHVAGLDARRGGP